MARSPEYIVELLDSSLKPLARVKGFYPLPSKRLIEYGDQLSAVAKARFRVSTQDPLFDGTGDIFAPWTNHVRITRAGVLVWQGIVTRNPHRTHHFVEVEASTYTAWFEKVLVKHSVSVAAGDGKDHYRTFNSGTMGLAITAILQETKAKFPAGHPMASLVIGQIDNPNFPPGYVKADGVTPLTGPWVFGPDMTVQYDYKTALYILTSLGIYGQCDFRVIPSTDLSGKLTLTFEFKQFIGKRQPELMFEYGTYGTILDYDLPQDGARMVNQLTGVAVDPITGAYITAVKTDTVSVAKYGLLEGVAAFSDVKNANVLTTRLTETLRFISTPNAEVNVDLGDNAYPLGTWGVGDIVTIKVKDRFVKHQSLRRIVAYKIKVAVNGEESVNQSTNVPRANQ